MDKEVMMDKEDTHNERINYLFKEFIEEKYYKIDRGVDKCTADIRDLNLSIELLRREVAVEFVSHTILDLFKINEQMQITALGQEIGHCKDEIQGSRRRAIGKLERIWLHVGSAGGFIGLIVLVIVEYVQRAH